MSTALESQLKVANQDLQRAEQDKKELRELLKIANKQVAGLEQQLEAAREELSRRPKRLKVPEILEDVKDD